MNNNKIKKVIFIACIVLIVSIFLISGSMAFYRKQLESTKKYVITASSVILTLDETSNDITINNTLPQTDSDGMTNSAYTFSLGNIGKMTYSYTIYLEDNNIKAGSTRVSDNFIKYYLTNDSLANQKPSALLSSLPTDQNGRILETGTIAAGAKYKYSLRFWVDYNATTVDTAGKAFSVKLNIIAN